MSDARKLNVDVAKWFNLDFLPFGTIVDPEGEFLVTQAHRTLRDILIRAANAMEYVAVIAPPASGKTVSMAWVLDQLEQEGKVVIRIDPVDAGKFTISKLKREIMNELTTKDIRSASDNKLRAALAKASSGNRRLVLALDNAHGYPVSTLTALRRFNEKPFAMRQRMMAIVFSGYPQLDQNIQRYDELNSRFVRYEIQAPVADEVVPYMTKRLKAVNGSITLFTDEAINYLVKMQSFDNVPVRFGELNRILGEALYQAAVAGEQQVTREIMEEADIRGESIAHLYELAGRPSRKKLADTLKIDQNDLYTELARGFVLRKEDRNRLRRTLRTMAYDREKAA